MRYSEAVKRHKLETKQRIFNSIMAAAEKETSADRSAGVMYGNNRYERDTKRKDTITMSSGTRSAELNEVRSRKGGVIAAACALLMLGGGAAAFANSGALKTDDTTSSASSAVSSAAPAAENSDPGKTEAVVTDVDSKTEVKEIKSAPVKIDSSEAAGSDNTVIEDSSSAENVAPAPEAKNSFGELLDSADNVFIGKVISAEPLYLDMGDGTSRYVIKYILGNGFCDYMIDLDELYDYDNDSSVILYQYADEGAAPQFKEGETAIFMTAETKAVPPTAPGMTGAAQVYIADKNGGFEYDSADHQIYNLASNNDSISLGMRDYLIDVIMFRKNSSSVRILIAALGENVSETAEQSADIPSFTVTSVNWNAEYALFEMTVNYNPQSEMIRELDSEGESYDITNVGTVLDEKRSGFDEMDIRLKTVSYNADRTAVKITLEAFPRDEKFDTNAVYSLKYDPENSGLSRISVALDADAVMTSEGVYDYNMGSMTFDIVFDKAGEDDPMEFDTGTNFVFLINGISSSNGQDIDGEYRFSYNYDASVADLPKTKMVTPATATNKY